MVYTVTLNPAIDCLMKLDDFAEGRVNRAVEQTLQPGGKGVNISMALKELGCESVALGFVAGITGRMLEDELYSKGIKTDFVHLGSGMTRINLKLACESETEINGRGPHITDRELKELFTKLDRISDGDILVLAGSVPDSLPDDIYGRIIERLDGRRVRVVVDAEGELLRKTLKYKPFLVKPNLHELGQVFGRELNSESEITEAAIKLKEMGAANVLVSMAGEGAILLDEYGNLYRMAAPQGEVKSSVGAGDSMAAGFLAGIINESGYHKALELGVAAGSATAFSDGIATGKEIEDVFNKINMEEGKS